MKRYVFGAALSMSGVFLTFVVRIVIMRAFGPETLASFAVWQNNVTLGSMIASLGQQNLIVHRFSTADIDKRRPILAAEISLILLLTGVAALVAWVILWAFTTATNAPEFSVTAWTLPATLLWALLISIAPIHRSIGSFYAGVSIDRVLPRLLFLVALGLLITTVGNSVFDLSIWFTGALLLCVGFSLWVLSNYKIGWDLRPRTLKRLALPWISSLGPFFFGAAILAMGARYPILITSYFFEPKQLGLIVLMLTFLSLISIPTATLNLVVGPNLRRRIAVNPNNTKLRIQYAGAAATLAILSSLVVTIVYPRFVEPENQLSLQVLVVFATSMVIAAVANAIIFFQFQAGTRYILNVISFTVLVLRIFIGLWGLSTYGFIGLALAEVISNLVQLALLYVVLMRRRT